MSPPELVELTPRLYASEMRNASEKTENPKIQAMLIRTEMMEDFAKTADLRRCADSRCAGAKLLDEEGFAQLVAADEGFHGAKTAEEILNFAILKNFLRGAKRLHRKHLKRIGVRDAVAMKAFGFFAVENGEDNSAGAKKIGERGDDLPAERRLEIVENVPQQNGIERRRRVPQIRFEETRSAAVGRHVERVEDGSRFAKAGIFLGKEVFPGTKDVFRRDAKAAFNEKAESGLPSRAEIEKSAAAEAIEVPEELLQTIGDTGGFMDFRGAAGTRRNGRNIGITRAVACLDGV